MGHLIILASGSPQFIIDELGRFLHAHEAVGTRARIREGLSTDELVPPIVLPRGKTRARQGDPRPPTASKWAAATCTPDSVADTPLFEEVGHPVVVNPKPGFRAEALRRGWEVVEVEGPLEDRGRRRRPGRRMALLGKLEPDPARSAVDVKLRFTFCGEAGSGDRLL